MELIDRKKYVWKKSNLKESVFSNNHIKINSDDIRSSNDLKELKSVANYLHNHLTELKHYKSITKEPIKLLNLKKYFFTQICLKNQVDFQIYKTKKWKKENVIAG